MAMLNNHRVIIIQRQKLTWQQWKFRSERMVKWKEGCWMSQHDRQNSRLSVYPLVNVNKKQWKHPPFLMGKSTISTGPCSIAMFVYQRVTGVLKQSLYCTVLKVLSCGCVVSYLILCGIVGTVGVWQKTWVTVRRLVVLSTKHSKFRVTHTIHSGKRDEDIYGASYRD